jgi:hypothetical protein
MADRHEGGESETIIGRWIARRGRQPGRSSRRLRFSKHPAEMRAYTVGTRVNSPKSDAPEWVMELDETVADSGSEWRTVKEIRRMVTKTKLPGPIKQPWHAVSVVAGPMACPAIEGLRHKRFLSDEAPLLPLPACSSPWRCKCIYRHYSDRRATPRRATDRGASSSPKVGNERREKVGKRGRRADDQTD